MVQKGGVILIQTTKAKKVFNKEGLQITKEALDMLDEHIDRQINLYAKRCKEGNVKRLTTDLFWVALGRIT